MTNDQITLLVNRIEKLEDAVFRQKKSKKKNGERNNAAMTLDFSLNSHAFVKRYASDKSGPQKFTLLVAFLSKGTKNKETSLKDVKSLWNKMTAKNLLNGKFNTFYSNQAKTNGWVNSPVHGKYVLANEWNKSYE